MNQSFSKAEIKERLESLLGAVLTTRRTASEPAQQISRFDRATQEFTLHWAGVIAKSNSEMAYQFVCHTQRRAFEMLDTDGVNAMDHCSDGYLRPGWVVSGQCRTAGR